MWHRVAGFFWGGGAMFGLERSGPNYPVTQHRVLPRRPPYECFILLQKNKTDKAESIRNAVGLLRTLRGDHNGSLTSERSVVSLLWRKCNIHKRMVRFQKLTRNLFLTLHGHNVHRQQQQLSKFLMRYQQFASHAYCGASFNDGVAAGKGFLCAPF